MIRHLVDRSVRPLLELAGRVVEDREAARKAAVGRTAALRGAGRKTKQKVSR